MRMITPTVYVVDDDDAVRESLYALLRSVDLEVETFPSASAFLAAYTPAQPGCLVLDVRLKGMSGLELQQELRQRAVNIPVIILTGHGDVPVAVKAMKNGAFEFLEKPFSKQVFLEHVRRAIDQDHRMRTAESYVQDVNAKLERLTRRENDVLEGILAGRLSKQIANELGVSKKTVDVHRANLMRKMQVDTVAALVDQVVSARRPAPSAPGAANGDAAKPLLATAAVSA